MAQVTGRAQQQHILDIKQGCARSTHEIAKTGIAWPDEAPDQPKQQQAAQDIAGPDMHVLQQRAIQVILQRLKDLALGGIGQDKRADQGPMEQANQWIPDDDCGVAEVVGVVGAHGWDLWRRSPCIAGRRR